jgi:type IV pilus assembly protein PilA
MFCPQCRMANPDSAQYCSKCGTVLSANSASPAPSRYQTPAPAATGSAPAPSAQAPTSGKAVASLVCGIFTFFLPASIAAIILGHLSLSDIAKSAGRLGGRGVAIAGLVLGYAGLVFIPFILIIAAIAIPNILRAKIAANEASAVGSLRTIDIAAVQYASGYENGFPSNFEVFGYGQGIAGNCNHAGLIDRRLATGQKNGYTFTYTPQFPDGQSGPVVSPQAAAKGCTSGGASGFAVTADPIRRGSTGQRSFFTDQTGVIRYSNDGESATADSPPLE